MKNKMHETLHWLWLRSRDIVFGGGFTWNDVEDAFEAGLEAGRWQVAEEIAIHDNCTLDCQKPKWLEMDDYAKKFGNAFLSRWCRDEQS